jgi:hypothetical protein
MGARESVDLGQCPLRAVRRRAYRRACRIAVSAALLAALAACRAPSPRVSAPVPAPPPAAHELGGDSYDWHGLLIAPFGSVLKNIPVALHEVLLFRDEEHGSASAADADTVGAECYAADAPAPRFLGRAPDEYVLCFKQDRLFRIQASVRVAAARATDVFAAACAGWLQNAAPATRGVGAPRGAGMSGAGTSGPGTSGPGTPGAETQSAGVCEGRDGDIRFRGRLEEEQDQAQPDRAEQDRAQPDRAEQGRAEQDRMEMVVSITLDGAAAP